MGEKFFSPSQTTQALTESTSSNFRQWDSARVQAEENQVRLMDSVGKLRQQEAENASLGQRLQLQEAQLKFDQGKDVLAAKLNIDQFTETKRISRWNEEVKFPLEMYDMLSRLNIDSKQADLKLKLGSLELATKQFEPLLRMIELGQISSINQITGLVKINESLSSGAIQMSSQVTRRDQIISEDKANGQMMHDSVFTPNPDNTEVETFSSPLMQSLYEGAGVANGSMNQKAYMQNFDARVMAVLDANPDWIGTSGEFQRPQDEAAASKGVEDAVNTIVEEDAIHWMSSDKGSKVSKKAAANYTLSKSAMETDQRAFKEIDKRKKDIDSRRDPETDDVNPDDMQEWAEVAPAWYALRDNLGVTSAKFKEDRRVALGGLVPNQNGKLTWFDWKGSVGGEAFNRDTEEAKVHSITDANTRNRMLYQIRRYDASVDDPMGGLRDLKTRSGMEVYGQKLNEASRYKSEGRDLEIQMRTTAYNMMRTASLIPDIIEGKNQQMLMDSVMNGTEVLDFKKFSDSLPYAPDFMSDFQGAFNDDGTMNMNFDVNAAYKGINIPKIWANFSGDGSHTTEKK